MKLKMYHLKTVCSTNLRKLRKPTAICISIIFIASIFAVSTARADSGATIIFSSGFEDGFENDLMVGQLLTARQQLFLHLSILAVRKRIFLVFNKALCLLKESLC